MSGAILTFADFDGQTAVTDEADVVIIGSGAAGATAARVLTEAGLDVVVLEQGPHIPQQTRRSDTYSSFKQAWRDMGFQAAQGKAFVPIIQGACVGGTTVINGAIIHRLPEVIYDQWSREHGVGDVLRFADLVRVFDRMDEELGVGPAPDDVLGRNNALMREGVERLGLTGNLIQRNVTHCEGSAHCSQGCPTSRKQSMEVTYIPAAVGRGARVYSECVGRDLIVEGGRAVGVRGRFVEHGTRRRGATLTVRARRAVLVAASAVQTPLFLAANGVGRQSRLVGRRFQAHPGTSVMGVFDDPVKIWFGATQGFETTHYWDQRMKFEAVGIPLGLGASRLPGFGRPLMKRIADWGHVAQWGVQVRCRAHGRVKRSLSGRAAIRFCPNAEDVATFKTGVRVLCEMMFAAGAHTVMPGVHGLPDTISSMDGLAPLADLPDDPRLFHYIAAHMFGTAVMGSEPEQSVVGPDCQAHELPGLFVTDSSCFPTNLGVNPQHPIAAVSWLVAERIADSVTN